MSIIKIIYFFLALVFIWPISHTFSAAYISLGSSQVEYELSLFDEDLSIEQSVKKASGTCVEGGVFLTNSVAFEGSYSILKVKNIQGDITTPSSSEYTMEPSIEIYSYGLRWFMWEFFNIKLGGFKSVYDPSISFAPALDGVGSTTVTDNGSYHGLGLGLTLKKMQIFYDKTIFKRQSHKDSALDSLGVRIFF